MSGLTILQINPGRNKTAHDISWKTCEEEGEDVMVASEPNRKLTERNDFWIWAESIEDFDLTRCYAYLNIPINESEVPVGEMMESVRVSGRGSVILVNFNAKMVEWGFRLLIIEVCM